METETEMEMGMGMGMGIGMEMRRILAALNFLWWHWIGTPARRP
jgi:hypothetical protein